MGDWFKGGRRISEPPCKEVLTRGELQRRLKDRIGQGDQEAVRQWERWKYADRLLDVFREKPIYPPQNNNENKQPDK